MTNTWGKGRGCLNCLWSVYHEAWEPRATNAAVQQDTASTNKFIGDADTGESFLVLVAQAMVSNLSGAILIFRKHIRPHWEDLRMGCHLTITSVSGYGPVSAPNFLDIFFVIVDEQLSMSALVAGVALWRDRERYLFTVCLISEDETSVSLFRGELEKVFPNDVSFSFVSHRTMSSQSMAMANGKRCLGPILDLSPTQSTPSDQPFLAAALQLPQSTRQPDVTPTHRPTQPYFAEYTISQHHQQLPAPNSLMMESIVARQSDSSFGIRRPTAVSDWAAGWTPSSFANKEAERSDNSKGTSVVSSESPRAAPTQPNEQSNGPITFVYHQVPQLPVYYHNTPPAQAYVSVNNRAHSYLPLVQTFEQAPPPYTPSGPGNVVLAHHTHTFGSTYSSQPPPPPPPPIYRPHHPMPSRPMMDRLPVRPTHLQSDRKPFIFKGRAYPPGLNRKEYRTVIHHSEENSPHPGAFAVPEGFEDGDIEYSEYYALKEKHTLQ